MSDWPASPDPELQEILFDISKDPRSTLFRVTPRDVAIGALEDVPSASAATAGWTPAERHLLTVHREQVASLLLDAFRVKASTEERAGRLEVNSRPSIVNRGFGPIEIGREARRLAASPWSSDSEDSVRTMLGELARGESPITPSFGQLAHAALRMESNETVRVFQAIDLVVREEYATAIEAALAVTERLSRNQDRACAWSNVGLAQSLSGNVRGALDSFMRASQIEPQDFELAANCFISALDNGDDVAARLAAERVDDLASPGDPEVSRLVSMHRQRKQRGDFAVTEEWKETHRRTEDRLGAASGAIAHAIIQD